MWRPASAMARRQPGRRRGARASTVSSVEVLAEAAAAAARRSPARRRRSPGSRGCRSGRCRPSRRRSCGRSRRRCHPLRGTGGRRHDQPGADAGGHLEVDEVRAVRARRPSVSSASAPRLASFSTWTGRPSRACISSAGSHADPAGKDRRRADRAGRRVDRPGQPDAHAEHALAGPWPPRRSSLRHELGGGVHALAPRDSPPSHLAPMSRPGWRATGRPRRPRGGACRSRFPPPRPPRGRARSATSAAARRPGSSGAGVALVVDDEPSSTEVARRSSRPSSATGPCGGRSSARLATPISRSAVTTRARLSSRREPSDPDSSPSTSPILSPVRAYLSRVNRK